MKILTDIHKKEEIKQGPECEKPKYKLYFGVTLFHPRRLPPPIVPDDLGEKKIHANRNQ